MLKYKTSIEKVGNDSKKPDYVYLNITIMNNSQGENYFGSNPAINFRDTLLYDVVENPSDYKLSISKFTSESGVLLPLWSPRISSNQSNLNLTVYNITLSVSVGGTTYTQTTPMIYTPENPVSPPSVPSLINDDEHYYYVYTYRHVCFLFNQMLNTCFTDLQTQVGTPFTASCPFIDYDGISGLFSLYFDNDAGAETFTVNFDANLYSLFYSFYFQNTNQLYIDASNPNNITTLSNGKKYVKITQDFISTSMWSPVSALVFTTTTIPIVAEQSTQPLIFSDTNMNVPSSNQVFQKIITDISIPADKASDWRSFITYTPPFPRNINLNSNNGLRDIDINVFFADGTTGQLIPVCLGNGGQVRMKLCFEKK